MIDLNRKLKNFGPLEALVLSSITYVVVMLLWTASTRSEVLQKANDIKFNHKLVVDFINDEVNTCSSNEEGLTSWGEKCNTVWTSDKIVSYVLSNMDLKNPYSINKPLIQTSQDPRIQAEGKAGQSTDKGIIFVSSYNFESEAGSEWVVGTCIKSPCVAAGNNELVSASPQSIVSRNPFQQQASQSNFCLSENLKRERNQYIHLLVQ